MRPQRVLIGLALGLGVGLVLASLDGPASDALVRVAEVVGAVWVAAIRMTVVPLVVSLLFVSVASVADTGALGRLGATSMAAFILLVVASTVAATVFTPWLLDLVPGLGTAAVEIPRPAAEATALLRSGATHVPGFGAWLIALVPTNPMAAAADGAMLPLVVFTTLLGLAVTRIGTAAREALLTVAGGLRDALLILVGWVIALAPVGVFALIVALVARLGASAVGVFGGYVAVVAVLMTLLIALLYPLARLLGGVSLRQFARAALPAQAVAITTRSSLAALPATIQGAEQTLQVSGTVAGFVLPLAVSIFKFAAPVASVVGTLFVARLYQVDLAPLQVAYVAVAAIALSFSTPGIPVGNLLVLAPIFSSLGLPLEGLGLLIALDIIPDTFRTTANVTANLAVTAIVARHASPSA